MPGRFRGSARACEHEPMTSVARLVTFVDLGGDDDGPDGRMMSVSATHDAELADGRRVTLLSDRGWGGTGRPGYVMVDDGAPPQAPGGIWSHQTVQELKETARTVVGPDEPWEDETWAEVEACHWEALADTLRHAGIDVDAADLRALPHDVELSDRILSRLASA